MLALFQSDEVVQVAQAIKGIGWPEALVLSALILGICYILGKIASN